MPDGALNLLIRAVGIASALDGGKGRSAEAVEAVRDCGAGALHVAAGRGRMAVCRYLVEELHVDVGAVDESGPLFNSALYPLEGKLKRPLDFRDWSMRASVPSVSTSY